MGINPNLVAVYDLVADTDGTLYLILEYVPGGTLADRLRRGPAPLADALRWAADAARGLQAAHDVGLVHRDVKPANIFLAADGRAQVGDFGIAQIDDLSGRTRTTVGHPGTPLYMSPEQAHMTAYVQPAADQYSLGLVLFELLTGVAYRRLGVREAQARLAAFPTPVAALIERMAAEDPDDRFPSMGGVLAAIQAIERDDAAVAPSEQGRRDVRIPAAAPPGVAVGSPDAPTDARGGTGGTPLVNLRPASPAPYPPSPAPPASARGRRGVLIGIGGLLIAALIAVGAFFALGRGGSSTQAAPTATAPATPGLGTRQQAQATGPNGGGNPQPSPGNGVVIAGAAQGATPTANVLRATATDPPTAGTNATPASVANGAGAITPDGSPVNVKIATPGQNARYTFAGTEGQAVAVQASKATFESCGTTIALLKPDDSPLGSPKAICGGTGFLDQQALPTSGTYTVLLNPDGAATGEATITVSAATR